MHPQIVNSARVRQAGRQLDNIEASRWDGACSVGLSKKSPDEGLPKNKQATGGGVIAQYWKLSHIPGE